MRNYCFTLVLLISFFCSKAQTPTPNQEKESSETKKDSTKKRRLLQNIGNGYLPFKYFNLDLRYLVKYNQYEGIRTGLGGETTPKFSQIIKLNSYGVYGFRDHRFKYQFGASIRLNKATKTWFNTSYTDDLSETGSTLYLTDKRMFQFFEPRLLNISLFHKHITSKCSIEHEFSPHFLNELEFSVSTINTTYAYTFVLPNKSYKELQLSLLTYSLNWSPFSKFEIKNNTVSEVKNGYPKFSFQLSQNLRNVFKSELNFTKLNFKSLYQQVYKNTSFSSLIFTANLAFGETPLTHLYHAYPNNITKETILQRFSVAGLSSFETMYFNEFFSDRLITFQYKYNFKPFMFSKRFQPELVLITRFALGNMRNQNRHQQITFNTLEKGYLESGLEINKLLFGFGLSGAYRYGAYHLPKTEDNIAVKFTFNLTL